VRWGGLEPPRLAAHGPQPCLSANSSTSARGSRIIIGSEVLSSNADSRVIAFRRFPSLKGKVGGKQGELRSTCLPPNFRSAAEVLSCNADSRVIAFRRFPSLEGKLKE